MLKGYKFSAVEAAVKYAGRLDVGLIFSETPATAVGMFTTNYVQAAPVKLSQPRLEKGRLQAVIANSGNANACVGPFGLESAQRMSRAVSGPLGIEDELVAVCSTGVIGRPLAIEKIEAAAPALVEGLSADRLDDFSRAIMTTDTVPKVCKVEMDLEGHAATLVGVAKGSGMLHPNMATMLVYLLTDANVTETALRTSLEESLPNSLHGISVDGDTSTNDTLLFMANGAAGGPEIHGMWGQAGGAFFRAVDEVLKDLAYKLVADAEGGTKVVSIKVQGAASEMEAEMVALSLALSPLCKTAFNGADPNWGRIICAAGYSGARVEEEKTDVYIGQVKVCDKGLACDAAALAQAKEIMKQPAFSVTIDLGLGEDSREFMTSDLSKEYVAINADYTT